MSVMQSRVESPLGRILITESARGVTGVTFESDAPSIPPASARPTSKAAAAVHDYFQGDLRALERIDIAWEGTDFQRRVWAVLRTIPAGETLSYADVAARIEAPSAVRAVGRANATNPISLFVPCHRVIAKSGALTGYAFGIWRKEWLLGHEAP